MKEATPAMSAREFYMSKDQGWGDPFSFAEAYAAELRKDLSEALRQGAIAAFAAAELRKEVTRLKGERPKDEQVRELLEWLRCEAADTRNHAASRREDAEAMKGATAKELRESKRLAERMAVRSMDKVSTSVSEAKAYGRMQESIADKLEGEAAKFSRWADSLTSMESKLALANAEVARLKAQLEGK